LTLKEPESWQSAGSSARNPGADGINLASAKKVAHGSH
jgi:hypothetical protein